MAGEEIVEEEDESLTPCPQCESPEAFNRRIRDSHIDGIQVAYISCSVCPYEIDLSYTTPQLEKCRVDLSRAVALGNVEIARFGAISYLNARRLDRLRGMKAKLLADIERRVREPQCR